MAGLDEAHARSVLAEMQDRLARDPSAALGVSATATAEEVRTAFLELTKQYHPVRFGRMAVDVQKLANEVFLALRAAHDALIRAQRRPAGSITRPPALAPVPPAAPGNGRTTQPLPPRPARSASPHDSGERAAWQPPATVIPSTGTKLPARQVAVQPTSRLPTSGVRPAATAAVAAPRDDTAVLDLLQRQQWEQARSALHQLLAREPSSRRLRALMAYARGREAQLDRRVDDARVELQDALDLDPDLQLAKTALTELFTRRK